MSEESERLAALEAQLRELVTRVEALEQPARAEAPAAPVPVPDTDLLEQMRNRSGPPYEQGDVRGAVTYAGAVRLGKPEYVWHVERPLPGLLALDPAPLAQVLAALGNPARLALVRALVGGASSSQQLQAALGEVSPGAVSSGQLYHHLKELIGAGIIEQHGRNDYRLAPQKIVPFLIVLAGALDLMGRGG